MPAIWDYSVEPRTGCVFRGAHCGQTYSLGAHGVRPEVSRIPSRGDSSFGTFAAGPPFITRSRSEYQFFQQLTE